MSKIGLLVVSLAIGVVGACLVSGCQKSADSGQITKEMFHPKSNPAAQSKFDEARRKYAAEHGLHL